MVASSGCAQFVADEFPRTDLFLVGVNVLRRSLGHTGFTSVGENSWVFLLFFEKKTKQKVINGKKGKTEQYVGTSPVLLSGWGEWGNINTTNTLIAWPYDR